MIFNDNEGRCLAVEIILNLKKTLLIGIYAPNSTKEAYFKEIIQNLDQVTYEQIMLMGDFNRTVNVILDRIFKKSESNEGKLPKPFLSS